MDDIGEVYRLKAVFFNLSPPNQGGGRIKDGRRAKSTDGGRQVIGVRSLFVKIFFAEIVGQHTHFEIGGARGV